MASLASIVNALALYACTFCTPLRPSMCIAPTSGIYDRSSNSGSTRTAAIRKTLYYAMSKCLRGRYGSMRQQQDRGACGGRS